MLEKPRDRLKDIVKKLDYIDAEIKGLLPRFSALAKQVFVPNPSDSDRAEFKTITTRILELNSAMGSLLREADEVAALESRPDYDFFSGSRFVPEICALGRALPTIMRSGKGNVAERVRKLYRGPSTEVESSIYELVVAASCIEKGREIEFLDTSGPGKKPDLRVLDLIGIPTVIECKMSFFAPLTDLAHTVIPLAFVEARHISP